MRMALYQPDIPQNTGAIMRTAACLGVACDVIGPAGFVMTDKKLRRAGMDYLDRLALTEHPAWASFLAAFRAKTKRNGPGRKTGSRTGSKQRGRLVLLSTAAAMSYLDFEFRPDDVLLAGSEGAGVPEDVARACDAAVRVPIVAGARSLNVAQALAMVLGEALRQTHGFPGGFPGGLPKATA